MSALSSFFSGVGVIVSLELRQRVRGAAWFILLGVYVVLVAIVTVVSNIAIGGFQQGFGDTGGTVYSAIIYFVLLLGTLVTPAFSGNAVNGDREAGTLATTQVTLVSTGQIIIGKWLSSWITALAFLAASVPFLIFSLFTGNVSGPTMVVSLLVLAVELGVVAAIGVGLSGIIVRPLFSLVVTYLVVAALSVGSLIAFGLGGLAVQDTVRYTGSYFAYDNPDDPEDPGECIVQEPYTSEVPRFDHFWGILVANPYVVLADAVPTSYNSQGAPNDLFGQIKYAVRQVQIAPELDTSYNGCIDNRDERSPTGKEIINSTTPGWFVGLLIHVILAAAALLGAWSRTRTPAKRLAKGSRIA
ncbi:MAG: transporter permease [Glaciihabitans sp.]|nr:transporter permease [Glaciihabitans sp.]